MDSIEAVELINRIDCALTHDIRVCDECRKCPGRNTGEIRLRLIEELHKLFNVELPYKKEN